MGVHKLFTFLRDSTRDSTDIFEDVDLVQVARSYPEGMRILVDFGSWDHHIFEKFCQSLDVMTRNKYLKFDGGEYGLLDEYVKSLIEALREVNIELVFIIDGAKGSSFKGTRQKMESWKQRHMSAKTGLTQCFKFLHGQCRLSQVSNDDIPRPCLHEEQLILSLQEAGCTIHHRISGEADGEIAQRFREDEKAFCVLSSDTDFCIFPECTLIFLDDDHFDMKNDLCLGLAKKPDKLLCRIIRNSSLIQALKLPDDTVSLIEVALMAGCDFTLPHLKGEARYHEEFKANFHILAGMVKQYHTVQNCPFYKELFLSNREARDSLVYSRQFYRLILQEEEDSEDPIFQALAKGVTEGRYPSRLISMYRSFYWHEQVLEDIPLDSKTAESALAPLRSFVYAMLLPHNTPGVCEYGRMPGSLMDTMPVPKAADDTIPSIVEVQNNSYVENKALFGTIITHMERTNFFDGKLVFRLFGTRTGFLVYLLRYFLVLNHGQNLHLREQEFHVLVAWTLGKHDQGAHRRMCIVPSGRCITVQSWFQCLYRTAYVFLGKLLGLSHKFPAPKDVFSGASWVALYTACAVNDPDPEFRQRRPLEVNSEDLNAAHIEVLRVVGDNRHIIKHVTQGYFD